MPVGQPLPAMTAEEATSQGGETIRRGDTVLDEDGKAWEVIRLRPDDIEPGVVMVKARQVIEDWFPADSLRTMKEI